MALKNISAIEGKSETGNASRMRLIDNKGDFIQGFDYYTQQLINRGLSYSTRIRYSSSAARFLDFLYEVGVLGKPTTILQINEAVDFYPIFLRDGKNVEALNKTELLRSYATAVKLENGLAANSFAPTLAAVNLFLEVAQALADEAVEKAKEFDSNLNQSNFELIINAINGMRTVSHYEKKRLQQNSVLGSVMRLRGTIKRPHRLRSPLRGDLSSIHARKLDFPLPEIAGLLESSTSYRDKALWSLLAASGIRLHEALNLKLEHIDPVAQLVYVEDPHLARFGAQMSKDETARFKGRNTSRTFLFEPLKSEFFKYYELYLRNEYIATKEHDFFFQIVEKSRRGIPLKNASDAALTKNFKKTVQRAKITKPGCCANCVWTIHSLRHAYGVYLLNYVPVPGGAGLRITEVQQLMGHKNIKSTQHYARHEEVLLKAKLEAADDLIYRENFNLDNFPHLIANRLIGEAKHYLQFGGERKTK